LRERAESEPEQQVEMAPMIGVDLQALNDDQEERGNDGNGVVPPR
jgi:hypothetical protein